MNLLSIKKIYKTKLKSIFISKSIYFIFKNNKNNRIIIIKITNEIYIILYIKLKYKNSVFFILSTKIINKTKKELKDLTLSKKKRYLL